MWFVPDVLSWFIYFFTYLLNTWFRKNSQCFGRKGTVFAMNFLFVPLYKKVCWNFLPFQTSVMCCLLAKSLASKMTFSCVICFSFHILVMWLDHTYGTLDSNRMHRAWPQRRSVCRNKQIKAGVLLCCSTHQRYKED